MIRRVFSGYRPNRLHFDGRRTREETLSLLTTQTTDNLHSPTLLGGTTTARLWLPPFSQLIWILCGHSPLVTAG
jgi:hypothetical protein